MKNTALKSKLGSLLIILVLSSGCILPEIGEKEAQTAVNTATSSLQSSSSTASASDSLDFNEYMRKLCPKCPVCNDRKAIDIIYKNVSLNISHVQTDALMNMRPNRCHTIGCSQGFHLCKEQTLDVLGLKKSEFWEAPRESLDWLYGKDTTTCYPLDEIDGFGAVARFNRSYWKLMVERDGLDWLQYAKDEGWNMSDLKSQTIKPFDFNWSSVAMHTPGEIVLRRRKG